MKVGVIGLGKMGKLHKKIYQKLGHEVVSYDYNVKDETSVDTAPALYSAGVTHVSICTPTDVHDGNLERGINLGDCKNFLVEKPLTACHSLSLKLINRYPDVRIMVGFLEIFNDAFIELKKDSDKSHLLFCRHQPPSERNKNDHVVDSLMSHDIHNALNLDPDLKLKECTFKRGQYLALLTSKKSFITINTSKESDKVIRVAVNKNNNKEYDFTQDQPLEKEIKAFLGDYKPDTSLYLRTQELCDEIKEKLRKA